MKKQPDITLNVKGINPLELRQALGSFATGVTVITAYDNDESVGVTANSFNSVSLDPPLVLWSLGKSANSMPVFRGAEYFAVHILAEDQKDISNRFAKRGEDKFAGLDFESGVGGVPLLHDCSARFECKKAYEYEGGDHIIFVGEVVGFSHQPKLPLIFHAGQYGRTEKTVSAVSESVANDRKGLALLLMGAYHCILSDSQLKAEQRGLRLVERYILSILLSDEALGLEAINELIAYTGIVASDSDFQRLIGLGMITSGPDLSDSVYSIKTAGRNAAIEMIASVFASEAEAELALGGDFAILKNLLRQLIDRFSSLNGANSLSHHLDLMSMVVNRID